MLKAAEAADAIILRDIRKIYGTGEGQVHALDLSLIHIFLFFYQQIF